MTIYALGHSTREFSELVGMLEYNKITELVDIRSKPGSRRSPQFNAEEIAWNLPSTIRYSWEAGLGGFRKALPLAESVNHGWTHASFRGYADYMQTGPFRSALARLTELQLGKRVAIMCTEAVPWKCHRRLVTDALIVSGVLVYDLISQTPATLASMTSFATVDGIGRLTYP